jgi:hypothetical protein
MGNALTRPAKRPHRPLAKLHAQGLSVSVVYDNKMIITVALTRYIIRIIVP